MSHDPLEETLREICLDVGERRVRHADDRDVPLREVRDDAVRAGDAARADHSEHGSASRAPPDEGARADARCPTVHTEADAVRAHLETALGEIDVVLRTGSQELVRPDQEVVDARDEGPGRADRAQQADGGKVGGVQQRPSGLEREHTRRRRRSGLGGGVVGVGETQRIEQALTKGCRQVRARDRGHDLPEQDRVDVAVADSRAGLEVERAILHEVEDLVDGEAFGEIAQDEPVELLGVLGRSETVAALRGQPARVRQQLADRDAVRVREVGHVGRQRVIERELAFVDELQREGTHERLGDAGDRERDMGIERDTRLRVGPRGNDEWSIVADAERDHCTGHVVARAPLGEEIGDPLRVRQRDRHRDGGSGGRSAGRRRTRSMPPARLVSITATVSITVQARHPRVMGGQTNQRRCSGM